MIFNYHPDIRAKYPNLVGGIVVAHGVKNGASTPELLAAYHAEQQATLKRIGETPLSQIESLAAWRGTFRSFGVDPTQIRSACEALLRRLTKQGDIRASTRWWTSGIWSASVTRCRWRWWTHAR